MMSPYNYVANNPINAIDPDGRYVDPLNEQSKKDYEALKEAYKKGGDKYKDRYNALIRMEEATDVTYRINTSAEYSSEDENYLQIGQNGSTLLSKKHKSGEDMMYVDILVEGNFNKSNKFGVLGDELEHGRQVLDGEMGFKVEEDAFGEQKSYNLGYDKVDELQSQEASIDASTVMNESLSDRQNEFLKDKQAYVNRMYSSVPDTERSGSGNQTASELKDYINKGSYKQFIYREKKNGKYKNINIK